MYEMMIWLIYADLSGEPKFGQKIMDVISELNRMKAQQHSISSLREAEGYTHLQIICCGEVVRAPLDTLSAGRLAQTVEQLAPLLVCHRCGQRATPGRVGLWKHGMKRYG